MSDKVVTVQVAGHEPVTLSANAIERITRLCAHAWNDEYLWEQGEECKHILDGILELYRALHPEYTDEAAARQALDAEHFMTY